MYMYKTHGVSPIVATTTNSSRVFSARFYFAVVAILVYRYLYSIFRSFVLDTPYVFTRNLEPRTTDGT